MQQDQPNWWQRYSQWLEQALIRAELGAWQHSSVTDRPQINSSTNIAQRQP